MAVFRSNNIRNKWLINASDPMIKRSCSLCEKIDGSSSVEKEIQFIRGENGRILEWIPAYKRSPVR